VSQQEARDVTHQMMAHRPVEIHRPQRGAGGRRRRVADDERRMGKIELQVERVVLTRADGQGESKVTFTGTVKLPLLPCLPRIWIAPDAMLVPGRPESRFRICSDVSSRSPDWR